MLVLEPSVIGLLAGLGTQQHREPEQTQPQEQDDLDSEIESAARERRAEASEA